MQIRFDQGFRGLMGEHKTIPRFLLARDRDEKKVVVLLQRESTTLRRR